MPPTIVETDIKDILSKIDNRLECIENDLTDLKINQTRMEERLSGQISLVDEKLSAQINLVDEKLSAQISLVDEKLSGQISLVDEKVSGLGKRVEFQEFINRSILAGLILLVLGGAAKYLGIMPKP
ncbi:MAG: hypothetical protein DCF12_19005 [Snowella sp.]|nr:MAG: hypothetical protein DCF12_19005 [Snowella sp.]